MSDLNNKLTNIKKEFIQKEFLESQFVEIVSKMASLFISVIDIDYAINMSLETVGKAIGANRVYVFLFSNDNTIMTNTHEWCSDDTEPQIDNLQNIPSSILPWWMEKLNNHEIINVGDIDNLPPEASNEKQILLEQDIKSILVLPLIIKDRIAGFTGFDNCIEKNRWSDDDIRLLNIFTEILGNAIDRKQTEQALIESEKMYRILFESGNDAILVYYLNQDGLQEKFIEINKTASEVIGYTKKEITKLYPKDIFKCSNELENNEIINELLKNNHVLYEATMITKDKIEIPVEVNSHLFYLNNRLSVISIARDITDRRKKEILIQNSLKEKEILLKEIHHRVKNNLQIISSLLNLQLRTSEKKSPDEIFYESQNRIKTMALIHEKLYQSSDLALIDFSSYIKSLINELFHSYNVNTDIIRLKLDLKDNIYLDIDTSIPCGLIINELVSNSLKYAFNDKNNGFIRISIESSDNVHFILIIEDNGIGIDKSINVEELDSLGLQLVYNLTKQLNGKIDLIRENGTKFIIQLKKSEYKKRI